MMEVNTDTTISNIGMASTNWASRGAKEVLPPVVGAVSANTDPNVPVNVAVMSNSSDPQGLPLSIKSFDASTPLGGTVSQVGDLLQYAPPLDVENTDDTFAFTITNGSLDGSNTATVSIRSF